MNDEAMSILYKFFEENRMEEYGDHQYKCRFCHADQPYDYPYKFVEAHSKSCKVPEILKSA